MVIKGGRDLTEVLRRAVIQGVAGRFGLPVYGQAVPQGGKRPCFTIEMTGVEQKRLLNSSQDRKSVV